MKAVILTFLAVVCLPFFGVGLYEAYQSYSQTSGFVHTEGIVVGNYYAVINTDGSNAGAYQPQVEFSLPSGEKKRFTDAIGSLPPDYEIGATVPVIYNPNHPPTARIHSWKHLWCAPVLFMTIGLLPLIIGFILMRRLNL